MPHGHMMEPKKGVDWYFSHWYFHSVSLIRAISLMAILSSFFSILHLPSSSFLVHRHLGECRSNFMQIYLKIELKSIKKYLMIIEYDFHRFRPNFCFGLDFFQTKIFWSGPDRYLPTSGAEVCQKLDQSKLLTQTQMTIFIQGT